MTPQRIQRQRVKGWRKPPGSVIVDRSGKWGNPYVIGAWCSPASMPFFEHPVKDAEQAVAYFQRWLDGDRHVPLSGWNRHRNAPTAEEIRAELAGKDLVCWCKPDAHCHADVLLRIANGGVS